MEVERERERGRERQSEKEGGRQRESEKEGERVACTCKHARASMHMQA